MDAFHQSLPVDFEIGQVLLRHLDSRQRPYMCYSERSLC